MLLKTVIAVVFVLLGLSLWGYIHRYYKKQFNKKGSSTNVVEVSELSKKATSVKTMRDGLLEDVEKTEQEIKHIKENLK